MLEEPSSNLKNRVIPIILFYNYLIVKSKTFGDYRVFGNLEQTISVFNQRKVDELIILDIGASKQEIGVNLDVLKILSRSSLMPIGYGGGITKLDDIQKCLAAGCDKVVINTACIRNSAFINEAANAYGSQCIVASVDYCLNAQEKNWTLFSHASGDIEPRDIIEYINHLIELGAGEIILTSVDNDGRMNGYEISLIKSIIQNVNIPLLINGGCGHPDHMREAFDAGASACCASSIFYYTEFGYRDIKTLLRQSGINVRLQ